MNTNHDRAALSKAGVSPKRARYTIECQTNELGDGISNNLHTTRVSDEIKKKQNNLISSKYIKSFDSCHALIRLRVVCGLETDPRRFKTLLFSQVGTLFGIVNGGFHCDILHYKSVEDVMKDGPYEYDVILRVYSHDLDRIGQAIATLDTNDSHRLYVRTVRTSPHLLLV